ncbi:MAG: homoserine dehydrogenase, partial [Oscillospiraceae bacterium]
FDSVIKLIGKCKENGDGKIFVTVAPFVVSKDCPLSAVKDVFNGVLVKGNCVDDVMFYGRGAGKLPTASAVVADIVDALRADGTIETLWWDDCKDNIVSDYKEEPFRMMVRVKAKEIDKALINKHFENVTFVDPIDNKDEEICFVTEKISTYDAEKSLKKMGKQVVSMIKILD